MSLLAVYLTFALAGSAVALPAPSVRELEEDGVAGLEATFLVMAPPERVLATLWDVKRFPAIFPDIQSMTVLARGPTRIDVQFKVDATLKQVTYTLRRTLDVERGRISWVSIDGDLEFVKGSWTVRPGRDPQTSQVTYTSFVDVGYIVPTSLVRDLALGKVNRMAERVRAACVEVNAEAAAPLPPGPPAGTTAPRPSPRP